MTLGSASLSVLESVQYLNMKYIFFKYKAREKTENDSLCQCGHAFNGLSHN